MITTALLLATLVAAPSSSSPAHNWDFNTQHECAAKARELNEMFARFKRDLNDGEGELVLVECKSTGLTVEPSAFTAKDLQ